MAMRLQLTDRFCAHAKATEIQTDYFDETIPGLALRVTSKGTKAWTFLFGTPRRRVTLGRYPSISLANARTLALETKEGRTAGSIAALAETYLRSIAGNRSAKEVERRLRKDVLPVIGHIPLRDLHRRDIIRVIDAKAYAPIAARRAFQDVRAMVRWAVARGDLDHNPIDGMKGPAASKARERVLSDDEIRILWSNLNELRDDYQRIIKLCLITAQRLGEVCGISRNEIDVAREVWNIPGSRTKNGHPHSVPLTRLAIDLLPQDRFNATQLQVSGIVGDHQLGIAQHWTCHDLRRTALTKMASLGIAPIVLGHIANHRTTTKAGITLGVYIQFEYEKEKREALSLWAERLDGIVSGGAKVLAMRSKGSRD
jgi:integrase